MGFIEGAKYYANEEGNVLMSVLACLPFCDEKSMNVPFPPINKEASTNYLILKGQLTPANDDDDKEVLTDDDVRVVSKAVTSWALSMFQHAASSGIQKLINIQYGYRYDDRIGLNLSLECCYNMTTDIQDNCIETLSGYTSESQTNDNIRNKQLALRYQKAKLAAKKRNRQVGTGERTQVVTYKTVCKYLRGSAVPFDPSTVPKIGVPVKYEIAGGATPDSSANAMNSSVASPDVTTTGVNASPGTWDGGMQDRQAGSSDITPSNAKPKTEFVPITNPNVSPHANTGSVSSTPPPTRKHVPPTPETPVMISTPDVIFDDVSTILDINRPPEFPVYVDPSKIVSDLQFGDNGCILILVSKVTLEVDKAGKIFVSMNYNDELSSYWGLLPINTKSVFKYATHTPECYMQRDHENCFVNYGVYQVPLFCGKVPPEVVHSSQPFETLIDLIKKQQLSARSEFTSKRYRDSWVHYLSCLSSLNTAVAPAPNSEEEGEDGLNSEGGDSVTKTYLKLSNGGSVLMKLSDARYYDICNIHLSDNLHLSPNTTYLDYLLSLFSHTTAYPNNNISIRQMNTNLKSLFYYDPMKFDASHDIREGIPVSVKSVWNKVTGVFMQQMQEYYLRVRQSDIDGKDSL